MKGRGKDAPHRDRLGSTLDVVLPVIPCDYGSLTEVGDELVVALFATCPSSTNVFATLCMVDGPKDAYVVSGSFCVVDL